MSQGKDTKDSLPTNPSERVQFTSQVSREDAAKRPLKLETYNFNHPRRGKCLVINMQHFDRVRTGQLDRDGTQVDASAVESVFIGLGFDVFRHDDLSCTDLSLTLRQVADEDHSDADCFVCVILSHGEDGYVYGTDGRVSLDSIFKRFKGDVCESLAGKPKLFFIQACRGRKYDWGVEVADADYDDTDAQPITPGHVNKIPIEADLFFAYSVVPGYFSWRNNVDGSWFVQALWRVFKEFGDQLEIHQLMTLVSKSVAYDFQSCTDEDFTSGMKQVPCYVSTLTKQVFFKPKY